MRIPDHIKDEILRYGAANIAAIIGEVVPLQKSGNNLTGCCPFHGEKTPSFVVSPERGTWHCFGTCSEGGDVAKFLMKINSQKFGEVLHDLARRGGITIPGAGESAEEKEQKAILSALAKAEEFYRNCLTADSTEGRTYTETRMSANMVEYFGIGFAPKNGGGALVKYLEKLRIPMEIAEKAGLVRKDDEGRYRDVFWGGRVMFPIKNKSGRTIGFAARRIDGVKDFKYVNSPETVVYKKHAALYGLDKADLTTGEVFVVEGYLDLMQAWFAGIRNVVAACGTAFTKEHIQVLKKNGIKKLNLMFDGDGAGTKAIERGVKLAIDADMAVTVYLLPEGQDPDDFFKAGNHLDSLKTMSGLDFLAGSKIEMSATYQKLHRAEKLEKAMLRILSCSPDARAVAASWGDRLLELFSPENAEAAKNITNSTQVLPVSEPLINELPVAQEQSAATDAHVVEEGMDSTTTSPCPRCGNNYPLFLGRNDQHDMLLCAPCGVVFNERGELQ